MTIAAPRASTDPGRRGNPWATGLTTFAGILMAIVGVDQVLLGISALLRDDVYVRGQDYAYEFDLTTWGWVHLVFGVLLALTGFAILGGREWARAVGMVLAALSLVVNFAFVPYSPVWSVLLIALDVAVIWGLAVHRPEPRGAAARASAEYPYPSDPGAL